MLLTQNPGGITWPAVHFLPNGRHRGSSECRVCLGPHDEEVHAATLSVRSWFRTEVLKGFALEPPESADVLAMCDGLADSERLFAEAS